MESTAFSQLNRIYPPPVAGHLTIDFHSTHPVTIICYENEVPSFVESELERLHANFFSTVAHIRESGRTKNANTYVVYEAGKITSAFLFIQEGDEVRVLNEVIKLNPHQVSQFANYIFSTYSTVDIVSFHAVDADIIVPHRPFQRINCLEDIVLELPKSPDDYFKKMGKSTRKTIKNYTNKLRREHPTFKITVYEKSDAREQDIRTIIQYNKVRMLTKGRVSAFDEEATVHIINIVKHYGVVCVARINGEICAGTISYRVGDNFFMHVSAHDPLYDRYRLGLLNRYFTICECIRRGGKECHFLWGRQEFKFSLMGKRRDLHDLIVYRSRVRLLLQSNVAILSMLNGVRRQWSLFTHSISGKLGYVLEGTHKLLNRFGVLRKPA
jgi:hypothetical protein